MFKQLLVAPIIQKIFPEYYKSTIKVLNIIDRYNINEKEILEAENKKTETKLDFEDALYDVISRRNLNILSSK